MSTTEQPVALVTGASRGIGKAIALRLQAQGMQVIGTATSEQGAASIQAYLSDAPVAGHGLVLNVTQDDSIQSFLAELKERKLSPLVLVNNAGITRDGLLMRMGEADWDEVLNANLTGAFKLTKAMIKAMMKARWGRIINISSVVGRMGNPGQANYAASKAGIEGFTKALALELGSRNITVNAVAPGFIGTDMTDKLDDDQKARMMERIPLQRYGTPEEVAASVCFLSSSDAAYITGQTLQVNGGLYLD